MFTSIKNNIPSWSRWRALPSVLNYRERVLLAVLLAVFIFSSLGWTIYYYSQISISVPAYGGQYREAIIGYPQYVNPILAESDVDNDLATLIFSGLMKYDENGVLQSDLAEKYEIKDGGKTYIFNIRKDIFWHDGIQLTANDVIFTINAFQNPEYKSPLSLNWRSVKIEKVDDFTVRFSLNNAFAPFLENLTVGIIPRHIWEKVPPTTVYLSEYNLNPIGSGPYEFSEIKKDADKSSVVTQVELKANEKYHFGKPYIETVTLKFFSSEEDAIKAFNNLEVDGICYLLPQNKDKLSGLRNPEIYRLKVPRYFAVFFNQNKSKPLTDKNVRKALAYATDKNKIIKEVLMGEASVVDSPILRDILGIDNFTTVYEFSLEKARKELSGWKDSNNNGILDKKFSKSDKDPTELEITLYASDLAELEKIANILKQQWEAIGGVKVNIEIQDRKELRQKVIKTREFDALLFGSLLYMDPDQFSYWHSSQKRDPGLNLSMYDNPDVDKLLEDARQTLDYKERIKKYDAFQQIIVEDVPAIFLFNPHYLYVVGGQIKGVDVKKIAISSKRFTGIEKWHIKTRRQLKSE